MRLMSLDLDGTAVKMHEDLRCQVKGLQAIYNAVG